MEVPHFAIKNRFQKGGLYQDLLTPQILTDICIKITGQSKYTVNFDDSGYNKGRLAILNFNGFKNFVSFSEIDAKAGRNYWFQSFGTALNRFITDKSEKKNLYYYFLPTVTGNFQTPYFNFNYRLMKTANVIFLNESDFVKSPILKFVSIEDIILSKDNIRKKNKGNKSTYITTNSENKVQIFGKTYGASKYETTVLCLAISALAVAEKEEVELHEIKEGGLKSLPSSSVDAIESLGVIKIYPSNRTIERVDFEENNSLRSATYTYNLLSKLGDKKCSFCECEIPQIIQGAHIWAVADIKKENQLTQEEKLDFALDADNGLWLCQNHHKLLDINILRISENGVVKYNTQINKLASNFVKNITTKNRIIDDYVTDGFKKFLRKRNKSIPEKLYSEIA